MRKAVKFIFSFQNVIFVFIGVIVFNSSSQILITTDAQRYEILARNLVSGRGYFLGGIPEMIFPPGFSLLLMPFILLGFNPVASVAVLMGNSVFILLYAIFELTKRFFKKTALLFSLIVMLNGNIFLWSITGQADVVWVAVLLLALILFIRLNDRIYLSGICAGLAYLLKPETLSYVAIFLIFYWIGSNKNTFFQTCAVFLTTMVFIILPYILFLYIHTGTFSFSGKIPTIYWDKYIEDRSVTREEIIYKLNSDYTLGPNLKNRYPVKIDLVRRVGLNLLQLKLSLFEVLLPFRFVFFTVLGVFLIFNNLRTRILKSLIFLFPVTTVLLFHLENRYLLPMLFMVIFWLFSAINSAFFEKSSLSKRIVGVFSFIAICLLSYYSFFPVRSQYNDLISQRVGYEKSINNLAIDTDTVIARKPVFSFYAEKDYYPLPWFSNEEEVKYFFARFENASVIFDEWSKKTTPKSEVFVKKVVEKGEVQVKLIEYES